MTSKAVRMERRKISTEPAVGAMTHCSCDRKKAIAIPHLYMWAGNHGIISGKEKLLENK
jgi:hypothetical protein